MKRYFTFIGMIVFIGLFLAVGVYIQQERQQQLATQEMYAKERHLVVYSYMPTAVNRDLAEAFYKSKHLRVQMVSMSEDGLQRALQKPVQGRMTWSLRRKIHFAKGSFRDVLFPIHRRRRKRYLFI